MLQHAIPQNISAYQFHLVGDMTLKQFLEILAGVALALLLNSTNLFGPIKLTLIVFSVLTGLALAFMPIEERPLDQWLIAFIKSIYAPTLFIWRKSTALPPYFTHVQKSTPLSVKTQELMAAQIARKKAGLTSFLLTLPQYQATSNLENQESQNLRQITLLFTSPPPPPKFTPRNPASPAGRLGVVGPKPTPYSPEPGRTGTAVPITAPIRIEAAPKPSPHPIALSALSLEPAKGVEGAPQPLPTHTHVTHSPERSRTGAITPVSDQALPFPSPPITPNTLVGMVLDSGGKIIDNAIIEVRDHNGLPVRATKTNRLGQFFSTTPLKNGPYELETEAPNQAFATLKLHLDGKIIAPLKIQANSQ